MNAEAPRPMRRSEKEVRDRAAIDEILTQAPVLRLALAESRSGNAIPYVVPVLFAYRGGRLYVHSAREGKKMELLARNPRVCVEVDEYRGVVPAEKPCGYSCVYRSVIGSGSVRLLEEAGEKRQALEALMEKYAGRRTRPGFEFSDSTLEGMAVLEISLEELYCKQSGRL